MTARFPQELLELVVDKLASMQDIKACALAGRVLLRCARTHLFRKTRIVPPVHSSSSSDLVQERGATSTELKQCLASRPGIARMIQHLEIVTVGAETSFQYDEDGQYLEERQIPWIMADEHLATILPLLCSLEHIALIENAPAEWNSIGQYSLDWTALGEPLRHALTAIFASRSLRSVHIRGLVIQSPVGLLALFSEATCLVALSLSRIHYTQHWDQRDPWPPAATWAPKIETLRLADLDSDVTCRYFLHSQIDLSRITSFTLATENPEWRSEFVDVVACQRPAPLTHLALWVMRNDVSQMSTWLSYAHTTGHLRSLHLFAIDLDGLMLRCTSLPLTVPSLELIILEAMAPPSAAAWTEALEGHSWTADLNISTLIEVGSSRLQRFEFRLHFPAQESQCLSFAKCTTLIRHSLRGLHQAGVLYIVQSRGNDKGPHDDWE
ncbi:hypothetical protein MIND_00431800 [Mycena indigotica]|uniref:Uncharacterized protein n=1 Tax=Mycena indigotica TaxID=2126181 RepID=A0A8H6W818_9AGAR|nr:uncharacterized protein MIND_00431800 [Mycena indigotica]KAF7306406.1 hypothetical protein MIND_00431800 [Mycena indigotica]